MPGSLDILNTLNLVLKVLTRGLTSSRPMSTSLHITRLLERDGEVFTPRSERAYMGFLFLMLGREFSSRPLEA